jgi:hypothetical protein
MELGSSFLFLQEQIKDIIIISSCGFYPMSIRGNPPGAVGAQECLLH